MRRVKNRADYGDGKKEAVIDRWFKMTSKGKAE